MIGGFQLLNSSSLYRRAVFLSSFSGDIFEHSKVIRVDRGLGLLLEIATSPDPTPAFVGVSDVADKEVKKLEKNFKEGSRVLFRILGFRHLEGLATGVLKGMVLLTMAVSLESLKPKCKSGVCNKASSSQIAFFYSALYIIALGAGGTKPNISTFGADQFDDFNPPEKKLKVSFFNWWMFSATTGGLMASLGVVYIQENVGWGFGYGIPTIGLILSLFIFFLGIPFYRHKVRKTTSPARNLLRVPIAAFANRKLMFPSQLSKLHEFDP